MRALRARKILVEFFLIVAPHQLAQRTSLWRARLGTPRALSLARHGVAQGAAISRRRSALLHGAGFAIAKLMSSRSFFLGGGDDCHVGF
jgi:hypothetical protein